MGQARVLLVADEQVEAEHLRRVIAQVAPDRGIKLATSEADALAALAEIDFEVVFVDLAEGAARSTEFLNEVWKQRPRTVRFFVAEAVNADLMITSALGAHHFVPGPVSEQSIAEALERADAINRFVRNERIQGLVSKMRSLPSRPSLYIDIMRELRSPSASADTVGDLVSKDLAISTKLIQLVNSAFYALQQQVTEPRAAVLLLGFETTASLVLSIEAMARFDKVKPLYFSMDRVWKHSQSVAQAAKRIAELASKNPEVARDAYTAGLLHDIGKLALALNFEDQYNGALKLAEAQNIPACEVEKQVFGATHAEAGAYLLCLWGLPLPIVEAVAEHHLPANEVRAPFSAATALHLAESLEAEAQEARGAKEMQRDFDYPPELEIAQQLPAFRSIVRGEAVEHDSSTKKDSAKSSSALKASSVPLSATGAPSPMVEVAGPGTAPKRNHLYAIVGCLLVFLSLGGYLLSNSKSPAKTAPQAQTSAPGAAPKPAAPPEPAPQVMATIAPVQAVASKLKLQAILYKGPNSSMIINGRSFHLGDEVEGARIVSVEQQSITIEKGGEQLLVSLHTP